jgi:nucleotide-binding universal stress UspA family protein
VATIVCGIDDSPAAFEALRVASALSAQVDARLVLAHAAGSSTAGADQGGLTTDQACLGGNRLLERAAHEHNPTAERRVEVGDPSDALARIAAEEAATLIILGSRSRRLLRGRLRRGLAHELAATAPCPVVVVVPPPVRR